MNEDEESDGSVFISTPSSRLGPGAPARGLSAISFGNQYSYRWSSLLAYAGGKVPPWMETERVLNSFELAKDGRGRRAYVAWLEARAAQKGGKIDPAAQEALRRGWYMGEDSFRD